MLFALDSSRSSRGRPRIGSGLGPVTRIRDFLSYGVGLVSRILFCKDLLRVFHRRTSRIGGSHRERSRIRCKVYRTDREQRASSGALLHRIHRDRVTPTEDCVWLRGFAKMSGSLGESYRAKISGEVHRRKISSMGRSTGVESDHGRVRLGVCWISDSRSRVDERHHRIASHRRRRETLRQQDCAERGVAARFMERKLPENIKKSWGEGKENEEFQTASVTVEYGGESQVENKSRGDERVEIKSLDRDGSTTTR